MEKKDELLKVLQNAIQPALQNMVLNYMSSHNVACAKIHALWVSKYSGCIFRDDNGTIVSLDTERERCPENVYLLTLWLSSEKEDKAEAISREVKVEFDRELDIYFGADHDMTMIGWDIKGMYGHHELPSEYEFYFQNYYYDDPTNVRVYLNEVLGSFWNGRHFLDEDPAPLVVNLIVSK